MTTSHKQKCVKFFCYLFLIVLLVICIVPVYMLLINATRSTGQINRAISLIPGTNLINNFLAFQDSGLNLWRATVNSMVISISSTFLAVYFSMLTAYAINVYDFRFKKQFFVFILAMTMVPMQLYIIGFFQYMVMLGLMNSYIPLIVPSIASAGTVFFAKQYFDSALMPDLIQSARIDGAHEFLIFNKIALPIAKPGAFTMAIFAFVASWNNFMTPMMILTDPSRFTLPLIIGRMQAEEFRTDFGAIYFGMAVTIIPIIIVYAMFSKHIISGISLGSVKE